MENGKDTGEKPSQSVRQPDTPHADERNCSQDNRQHNSADNLYNTTILSEAIAAILCIIYAFCKVQQFRRAAKYKNFNIHLIRQFVNGFGDDVIGAFTATTQIETLVQQVFAALGTAMVTFTGQNIGAGKKDRISSGVKAAMQISTAISLVLLVVFWIFGHPIMSIFVSNKTIIDIAATGIRITSLFLVALGGVQILRYMLNGAGDSGYALMNGIVEVIARIIFAITLTSIPFL